MVLIKHLNIDNITNVNSSLKKFVLKNDYYSYN